MLLLCDFGFGEASCRSGERVELFLLYDLARLAPWFESVHHLHLCLHASLFFATY